MSSAKKSRTFLPMLAAVCLGAMLGQVNWSERLFGAANSSLATANPFTPQMRIGANLYLQTSAEYRAACLQAYNCASNRLNQLVEAKSITGMRPAVIMDLDETVFDNSSFQTYLYLSGQDYTDTLWGNYEKNFAKDVTLIPGAKEFIEKAYAMGVEVIYVSNRLKTNQASTKDALVRLGIAGTEVDDRLYLKEDSSDKCGRRELIAATYNVLMLIGDNLRDFLEVFVNPKLPDNPAAKDLLAAIDTRKKEVDRLAFHWGDNWFIIPNPVYGEWDRLIKVDPISLMHPTSIPIAGQ
jgi:5'-nucleotidase (lipoprotein e(P4) family)